MVENTYFIYTVPSESRDSPTMNVPKAAEPSKKAGREVTSFSAGELEITPSKELIKGWKGQLKQDAEANPDDPKFKLFAETGKMDCNKYAPSVGTPGLIAVAAYKFSEDTGIDGIEAADVVVSAGAKGVLNGVLSQLQPGDQIIMAAPGWPTNYDMPQPGVEIIEVDTNGRGILSPEQLAETLDDYPSAKAILINAPSNPTGQKYDAEEREALITVIQASANEDFLVVMDDPYGKLDYDDEPSQIRGQKEKDLFEGGQIAYVKSMSKEYGFPGIRVGYVISKNSEVITQAKRFNENKGTVTGNNEQDLAQIALLYGDDFVKKSVEDLKVKRQALLDGIAEIDGIDVAAPAATIYGYIDLKGLKGLVIPEGAMLDGQARVIQEPKDAVEWLIEVTGNNGVPGEPFYAPGSPSAKESWNVRFCFSGNAEVLKESLDRIKEARAELRDPQRLISGSADNQRAV